MDVIAFVLRGIVPPVLVAFAILGPAWYLARSSEQDRPWQRQRCWPVPVALGLGAAAAHVAMHGWPPAVLDVELKHGLFFVSVCGAGFGALEATRSRVLPVARVVIALALPTYLLDFMRLHHWGALEGWLWTAGLGALVLSLGTGLEGLARRRPGRELAPAWTVLLAFAAGCLHVSGSTSLGQMAGALSAVLGVASALLLLAPRLRLEHGSTVPLTLLLGGLLLGGVFASELAPRTALLLAAGGLAPWLAELPPSSSRGPLGRSRGPKGRVAATILLAGAFGGLALGLELAAVGPDPYAF